MLADSKLFKDNPEAIRQRAMELGVRVFLDHQPKDEGTTTIFIRGKLRDDAPDLAENPFADLVNWVPGLHPRWPKGTPNAGKFMPKGAPEDQASRALREPQAPRVGEGFSDWRDRLWKGVMQDGTPIRPTGKLYRSMSDGEMQAAKKNGVFKPLVGNDLYVTDDPDRLEGGAYGGKGSGHIIEFEGVPTRPGESRYVDLPETVVGQVPMSNVTRVWSWDEQKKQHILQPSSINLSLINNPFVDLINWVPDMHPRWPKGSGKKSGEFIGKNGGAPDTSPSVLSPSPPAKELMQVSDMRGNKKSVYSGSPGPLADKRHEFMLGSKNGEPSSVFFPSSASGKKDEIARQAFDGGKPAVAGTHRSDGSVVAHNATDPSLQIGPQWKGVLGSTYPGTQVEDARLKALADDSSGSDLHSGDVSKAVSIDKTAMSEPQLRRAMGAIDEVHTDGVLPTVYMNPNPTIRGNGDYTPTNREIRINTNEDHPRLTAIHETGHFIDNMGLGGGFFASENPQKKALMGGVMGAIDSSRTMGKVRDMKANPSSYTHTANDKNLGEVSVPPDHAYLDYLDRPREKFARAYSQWIADRSSYPALKKELADQQKVISDRGKNGYPYFWPSDDFEPIAKQFDTLFSDVGWLKQ